jgi:hypothetical protein
MRQAQIPTGTAKSKLTVEKKRKTCNGNQGGATTEEKTSKTKSVRLVTM